MFSWSKPSARKCKFRQYFVFALFWENVMYSTYKKGNPNWHQYETGIHEANFKMVYHSENEEDTCNYKLSDRDNYKVSFVGGHFAGFLGKLKGTIGKVMRRTTIYTPDDVNSPTNLRAPYDLTDILWVWGRVTSVMWYASCLTFFVICNGRSRQDASDPEKCFINTTTSNISSPKSA